MWNRPGRKTHSDRLVQDETQDAVRPRCPTDEAINPNRKTRCPAGEAINSNRKTSAQREKDQRQLQPPDVDRGRRTRVNSVDSARAACEGPTSNSAVAAFPRGRLYGLPVQQGSRTQVSMVGNLGKSLTTHPLLPHPEPDVKTFALQPPKSFYLVTENVRKSSHSSPGNTTRFRAGYRRQSPSVTTRLTLRRSSAFLRALRVS